MHTRQRWVRYSHYTASNTALSVQFQHKQHEKPKQCRFKKLVPHTVMFPEGNNLDDTQDNELKIAILDMFKELKEHMNKCQNNVLENTSKELSMYICMYV